MIQGDALRAKVIQTDVERRAELSRLGEARAQERRAREVSRTSEDVFWREVARAAKGGGGAAFAPSALDRAREASRMAGVARERMSASERALIQQVGRALQTQARTKALAALQRRERMARVNQREERCGEDIQEAFAARLVGKEARGVRSPLKAVERSLRFSQAADQGIERTPPRNVDAPGVQALARPSEALNAAQPVTRVGDAPLPRVTDVAPTDSGRALQVTADSVGSTITCKIVDQPGAAVSVVVESSAPEVMSLSLVGRLALADRLRAAGIQVRRLEIRRESSEREVAGGNVRKRGRTAEERDESCIS